MKLSQHITEESLDEAATTGLKKLTQSIEAKIEGADINAIKNFHAGLMVAVLAVDKLETVDQLILALAALQTVLEIKIEKLASIPTNHDPFDP